MIIHPGSREHYAFIIHRAAAAANRRMQSDDGKSVLLTEDALLDVLIALGLIKIEDQTI